MYFLATNDVEELDISSGELNEKTAQEVAQIGLPRTLDLYSKYDVKSTFYFLGTFVEKQPESLDLVRDHGHEIGCHGYTHEVDMAFDLLSYNSQLKHLLKCRSIFKKNNIRVNSFRAPALRMNHNTVKALEKCGFSNDSSVSPQRFDGPFSYGSINKLDWILANRNPYMMDYSNPCRAGNSNVLEIPVSALVLPYIGTTARVLPQLTKLMGSFFLDESRRNSKPVVFLFHPNEALDYKYSKPIRRSKSFVSYFFRDILKSKIKSRNLGKASLKILESVLKQAQTNSFEFISATEFEKKFRTKLKYQQIK